MDLNSSFKTAQSNFYGWATKWAKDGENLENCRAPDLVDLVTILQILGFAVTQTDALNPLEMSMLSSGEKGLKINLSCGHSGARFVIEGVSACSCPQKMVENIEKIMGATEKDEKAKLCENMRLLDVPVGEKLVIQTVLNHLVNMMHYATNQNDQNENILQTVKNYQNQMEDEPLKQAEKNTPEVAPRFRSLDSLQDKTEDLPEPGKLSKQDIVQPRKYVPLVTLSSPNLSVLPKPAVNTSSPVANMAILKQGYSKLLSVQELVKDVIELFENSQELPKISFDVSNIKASTESLNVQKPIFPNSNSDPSLVVRRIVKPMGRPSIRSVSSPAPKNKSGCNSGSGTTASLVKPPSASTKKSENISPTYKISNKKYAHVKSTIPKGNNSNKKL